MLDSMPANPSPFPTTNQEFLEGIFGVHWPHVHVCAVRGAPADPLYRGDWRGAPAVDQIDACTLATNNYFCVGLFDGPRRLSFFRELVVLGVDDIGPKVDREKVLDLLGHPSYRIETSPGNEQWGYLMRPGLRHGDGAQDLQRAVRIRLTGEDAADPGQEGLNRYMRLPYGSNLKPEYGAGCRTRLLAWGRGTP